MSLEALRKALKTEKVVFGSTVALKRLKQGHVKCVFLASNCPPQFSDDIKYYAQLAHTEIIELKQPSDELALLCKKGFPVTVASY
jgi:ribosomal protein L30E